ncbi:hypothetical protein LR48_Vigan03g088400 [Vigna angularis]|uniref:Uncharacterized protein n=1 Tax=Phaseolus angularis TaxID=3914 RepID=A0A0L9U4B2_PHAAN|nr:hypothetical protein LR48_Vigan03g088400 [Vigna angularis]
MHKSNTKLHNRIKRLPIQLGVVYAVMKIQMRASTDGCYVIKRLLMDATEDIYRWMSIKMIKINIY